MPRGPQTAAAPAAPTATGEVEAQAPERAGTVLLALILVAAVANLNLSVSNVALPDIGRDFDASQTTLNMVAIGYSLGLAASVLYLGALGDRHGRKAMAMGGMALSIPACLLAGFAPSIEVLSLARVLGGLSAGMAYPTTLALVTALWSGPARTRAIALWSGVGGAITSLGPLTSGALLQHFHWGSVYLVTVPLALVALALAARSIPAHVNEGDEKVDNLGGILSVVMISSLVLAINFAPMRDMGVPVVALGALTLVAGVGFVVRQRRARNPLYDLDIARRRIFWVAALAGIVVFGALMGAMFIGQQFLQNVLGYSTLEAGAAALPGAVCMVLTAPRSAKLVESHGARVTLLIGQAFVFAGFVAMLVLWDEHSSYLEVGLGFALIGAGVGMAGTPASRSLTGSVPVRRAGMASGTADLQRDLGGAVLQSIFGALLTAGYASAYGNLISGSPEAGKVSDAVQGELTKSFASAADTATRYPQQATDIVAAARASFLDGANWAYAAGMVAVLFGAALVFFVFPRRDDERALLAEYHREDASA